MALNQQLNFDHLFKIGKKTKELKTFYYFDYDQRHSAINMDAPHAHSHFEICIFLDEKAHYFIQGNSYELHYGDIVLMPPDKLHKSQYPYGKPSKRLIIYFLFYPENNIFADYYNKSLSIFYEDIPILRFDSSLQRQIFLPLTELFSAVKNDEQLIELKAISSLSEFIRRLFMHQSKNSYVNHLYSNPAEKKIYDILSYINNHYKEELTLDCLSDQFNISTYYLSHKFKEVTGYTLNRYIRKIRIGNACCHLLEGDEKITDIAFQSGFNSLSQFNRDFKFFTNLTPRMYKNQHRLGHTIFE